MKASSDKYGGSARPKITQEDIEDGDAIVVTVAAVEEEKVKGDHGDKLLLVLLTEEFGDKVHRLNKTQRDYLIEKLGDETDDWIGEKVPLVKTVQPYGNRKFDTVWVAAPSEWRGIFKDAGITPKRESESGPAPKRTVTKPKRGRK